MASDDQELLAKIGQLAGKINRHKSQQAGGQSHANHHPSHHRDNAFRRGGAHQHRVSRPSTHRHRSLVLNNAGTANSTPSSASDAPPSDASTSWVSKNSRHRQLINSAVYQRENEDRAKAIEATRQQQVAQQNARETHRLSNHVLRHGVAGGPTAAGAPTNRAAANHEIEIQGIRFRVAQKGSKLVKVPGDVNAPSDTPRIAFVGGVKFHRSKNGNLYRDGVLKAQRQSGVRKVNEPCRLFSWTGACAKGPSCRYVHDASKVAVCKDFLQKGQCANGEECDLSHDLTPQRTPACLHYTRGNCAKFTCPYTHQDAPPGAPVCRSFGMYGYCSNGRACEERHVFECPDFANTGKCKSKGCKLLHRERASVLRKTGRAQQSVNADESNDVAGRADEEEDLSSDEESVNSNDVDSDEVEEFLGKNEDEDEGEQDADINVQRDYIAF